MLPLGNHLPAGHLHAGHLASLQPHSTGGLPVVAAGGVETGHGGVFHAGAPWRSLPVKHHAWVLVTRAPFLQRSSSWAGSPTYVKNTARDTKSQTARHPGMRPLIFS